MNNIFFQNVTPDVFAAAGHLDSDIWQTSLSLERGRLYLVEAASGKGKSTFCSYITGYRHDYTGTVSFDDEDTRHFATTRWDDIRRRHVSLLYQELRLFPELTALENVIIKNRLTNHKTEPEIKEWFDRLSLTDKLHARVGRMSFGQQQRVALMRALAQPFDFLLCDEPVSHLDDENAAAMAAIILEEARRQQAAVIVTSIGKHLPLPYDQTLRL